MEIHKTASYSKLKVNLNRNVCARLMYETLGFVTLKIYSMGQVWNVNCVFRDVSATIIIITIFSFPNLTSLNTVGIEKLLRYET